MKTSLVTRNVRIGARRTSVRLEPELWEALEDIALRERRHINDICTQVAEQKSAIGGFTSALRVYIVRYLTDNFHPVQVAPSSEAGVQRLSA